MAEENNKYATAKKLLNGVLWKKHQLAPLFADKCNQLVHVFIAHLHAASEHTDEFVSFFFSLSLAQHQSSAGLQTTEGWLCD